MRPLSDAPPRYVRKGPRVRYKVPITPMIVDPKRERRTVPTVSGKSYPVLFGPGATSLLLYLSLNPGVKIDEILSTLEIERGSFQIRCNRLRRKRIVVGNRRYQINPVI